MSDPHAQSLPARGAHVGAMLAGGIGAIAGLVIGLHVRAATAWFAVFELGVPATAAGAVVGFVSGCCASVAAEASHRTRRADHG